MEIGSQLCWLEVDENAAEDVEENVPHELGGGYSDTDRQRVRDSLVDIHPYRAEADVHHLAANDGLHPVPHHGQQDTIQNGEVCSVYSCQGVSIGLTMLIAAVIPQTLLETIG